MKKALLAIVAMVTMVLSVEGQTWYNMWYGGGKGQDYWISNTNMSFGFPGIQFTCKERIAGWVNGRGAWFINSPKENVTSEQWINALNSNLNGMDARVAIATQGWMAADRWCLGMLDTGSDVDGYIGYGLNNDMIISSQVSSRNFRLNSYGNMCFWANGGGGADNNPQLKLTASSFNSMTKFNLGSYNNSTVMSMFIGRNNDVVFSTTSGKNLRIGSTGGIRFWASDPNVDDDPIVGISNLSLHTRIPFAVKTGNVFVQMRADTEKNVGWLGTMSNVGLEIGTNSKTGLFMDASQNVYIGFDNASAASSIRSELKGKYSLFVKTGILSADYAIAPVSSWADHVFSNDYKLNELEAVESYISENGHLPEVPSAETVAAEGYSQHEMNRILLQKIEELTLYTIQQQKEIERLKVIVGE